MVGPVGLLLEDAPTVLNAASRQLREKSQKTRIGALSVLLQLVQAVPGCLRDHVGALVPGIQAALQDKSSSASQLKLTALEFLSAALEASDPVVFEGHAESLAPPVFEAVGERYYKVSAEALRVCRHLMRAVRPDATQALADKHKVGEQAGGTRGWGSSVDCMCGIYVGYVWTCRYTCIHTEPLYSNQSFVMHVASPTPPPHTQALVHSLIACLLPRVSAPDVDQEVKEAAIACAAAVVASASDIAPKETQQLLVILSERLKNETTRVAAVRAFSVVGVSPLRPDLGGVLQGVLEELTGFLRKANRQVKQASLAAQEVCVVVVYCCCCCVAIHSCHTLPIHPIHYPYNPIITHILGTHSHSLSLYVIHTQPPPKPRNWCVIMAQSPPPPPSKPLSKKQPHWWTKTTSSSQHTPSNSCPLCFSSSQQLPPLSLQRRCLPPCSWCRVPCCRGRC